MEKMTKQQAMKLWKRARLNQAEAGPWSKASEWEKLPETKVDRTAADHALSIDLASFGEWVQVIFSDYRLAGNQENERQGNQEKQGDQENGRNKEKAPDNKGKTPDEILADQTALVDELGKILSPALVDRIGQQFDLARQAGEKNGNNLPEYDPKTGDYIKPPEFDMVASMLDKGLDVFLVGPQGTGKSRMGREIARTLDVPYHVFSFSGGLKYSQAFVRRSMKNGSTVDELSPLLEAIQTPCIVHLEEIWSADAQILIKLNALLEDRVINTEAGVIERHPENRIMASANTNGRQVSRQYTAAQRADDSTLSRFVMVQVDYNGEVERMLCEPLPAKDRVLILDRLEKLRNALKANRIEYDASTRDLITVIRCMTAGLDAAGAFAQTFKPRFTARELEKIQDVFSE